MPDSGPHASSAAPADDLTATAPAASAVHRCPDCGATLETGRLDDLCPRCLFAPLETGEASETNKESAGLFPLPGHVVVEEISRGGMGAVYRARQAVPARDVAVKTLLSHLAGDPAQVQRFQQEARAVARLDHPAILPIFEVGTAAGAPYFTMKLARGGTLAQRLKNGPLPPREAAALIAQIADAVQHAHTHGVLHRDLKPGNILFDEAGQPFVSDFGLAKIAQDDAEAHALTQSDSFFGTPHYLPPEVAAGSAVDFTTAGDLYSLGAILYECLTGKRPHGAHQQLPALLRAVADEIPAPPRQIEPKIPRDLEIICLKCLEKSPRSRYGNCGDFAADLRRWLEGRTISARPAGSLERLARWARRNPALAAAAAGLILTITTGAALVWKANIRLGRALAETQSSAQDAREKLRRSLIDQARAQRLGDGAGRRDKSLELLRDASALRPSAEIRREAAAVLAQMGVSPPTLTQLPAGTALAVASHDLKFLAVAGNGGEIMLVDAKSLAPRWKAADRKDDACRGMRFSPDNALLLTLHESGAACLWDAAQGSLVRCWEPQPGWSVAADFGAHAAVLTANTPHGTAVWATPQSEQPAALERPASSRVLHLRTDASGARVALAGLEGIEVWDLSGKKLLWRRRLGQSRCPPAWSGDGGLLAAAHGDESAIYVLDAASGRDVLTLRGQSDWPASMAFAPGTHLLAAACRDGLVLAWNADSGRLAFNMPAQAGEIQFSRDGSALVLGSAAGSPLAVCTFRPAAGFSAFVQRADSPRDVAAFSLVRHPDKSWLLSASVSGVRLWSCQEKREAAFLAVENQTIDAPTTAWWTDRGAGILIQCPGALLAAAPTADGAFAPPRQLKRVPGMRVVDVSPAGDWVMASRDPEADAAVELWPLGDPDKSLPCPIKGSPEIIAASPDGAWVAAADSAGGIAVVAMSKKSLTQLPGTAGCSSLTFSPDGRWLLAVTGSMCRRWRLPDLREADPWPCFPGAPPPAVSADGTLAAVVQDADAVVLRDLATGAEILTLTAPEPLGVQHLCFAASGDRLYLLGRRHRLFEWAFREMQQELERLRF